VAPPKPIVPKLLQILEIDPSEMARQVTLLGKYLCFLIFLH
jgi:hypothetical protein